MGRHLADATVLKAAAAFEKVAPWAHRRPALISGNAQDLETRRATSGVD
jgi:hypothetical protein